MGYGESSFVKRLRERCQLQPGNLSLPEFPDPRIVKAALDLCNERAVKELHVPVFRSELPPEFSTFECVKCRDDDAEFFTAEDDSPLLQSGTLLRLGLVDAVLAGAVFTTADVIRAAIRSVGVAPGIKTISGSFFMNREHRHLDHHLYLYADSAVVIDPTEKQLLDIAVASVHTWRTVVADQEPVVAFLSFSTKGSAQHPLAAKMANAAEAFGTLMPEVICEGEIQFDAAFSSSIGKVKCPGSSVPGRANIFIFPNLDAGNIAYKISQRLGEFEAYGPVLQGAGKPFSDLSRGASAQDIKATAYINLLRARQPMFLARET